MFAVKMLKVVIAQRMSVRYAGWNIFGKGSNKADMYEVSTVAFKSPLLLLYSFLHKCSQILCSKIVGICEISNVVIFRDKFQF